MNDIITGAIAGLIASFLVLMAVKFCLSIIVPRLRKALHIGLDITGEWKPLESTEHSLSGIQAINIKQFGHDICGVFHFSKDKKNYKSFKFNGKCLDRVVMARFYRTRTSNATSGTILLDSDLKDEVLKGYICIVDSKNVITKYPIHLVKKEDSTIELT